MKVTIRDDEYAVEAITEHELIELAGYLEQQTSGGISQAKDLLLEIIPGLANSPIIRGNRLLLLIPELFLLLHDLQEALLNSPEYTSAKARLATVKGGADILKAIETVSPTPTVAPVPPSQDKDAAMAKRILDVLKADQVTLP